MNLGLLMAWSRDDQLYIYYSPHGAQGAMLPTHQTYHNMDNRHRRLYGKPGVRFGSPDKCEEFGCKIVSC